MVFGSSPANAAICLVPPRPSKADRRPPTHRCCRSSRRANTSATCSDQSPLATAVVAVMTEPSMGRSMALKTCRSIIYWVFSGNRNYTLPKRGFDDTELARQRYECHDCHTRFDDLTDTIFAGHHQPLKVWVLCLYFMGLNLSNAQIAHELDVDLSDVQQMTTQLRAGIDLLYL